MNRSGIKSIWIYFGASLVLIATVLIFLILLLSSNSSEAPRQILPTPTPIVYTSENYNRTSDGTFRFTPYQKTVINKTTDEEVQKNTTVIEKLETGDEVVYKIRSLNPITPDEIRTKNGVVVFEKNKTLVDNKHGPLPRINTYIEQFGQPEDIVDNINPYGWDTSAYIYASEGFTIIASRYTDEVYEIQRYVPMTVDEYKINYSEFLQPVPQERHI